MYNLFQIPVLTPVPLVETVVSKICSCRHFKLHKCIRVGMWLGVGGGGCSSVGCPAFVKKSPYYQSLWSQHRLNDY